MNKKLHTIDSLIVHERNARINTCTSMESLYKDYEVIQVYFICKFL